MSECELVLQFVGCTPQRLPAGETTTTRHPHSALAYRTPEKFARQWAHAARPSAIPNTTPPEASQGQALGACGGRDTPQLRSESFHQRCG